MAARKKRFDIDWETLKARYLASDKELYEYSFECTGDENLPTWATLKRKNGTEKWTKQRVDNRVQTYIQSQSKSQAVQDEIHLSMVEERKKLLSADKTIRGHIELAESFQRLYTDMLPSIQSAAMSIDWQAVAEEDPKAFIAMLKDLNSVMVASIEIQRKSMALSDFKIELISTSKSSVDINTRDLKLMSDKELINEYMAACKVVE